MTNESGKPKRAVIALGSNMGDPAWTVREAVRAVAELPSVYLIEAMSNVYRSEPAHVEDQDEFANAVMIVQVEAGITAEQLLTDLQSVETAFGRLRHEHWGPRSLDLDIIDFEGEVRESEFLKIPHPYALLRDFVVTPLLEIAPGYILADGCAVNHNAVQYGMIVGTWGDQPERTEKSAI
ncbi:MAG: 2-amino-4-hydroxy-6-hydroxymethyldihydropteridine diphosphokinase [Coriobacteriales bacterium]|jgi:2-amino-4-hydroxy-6-hydroxymethyldihydropteridine diphosphokinase|nr:2-amino-4-hydroxy-6-hydroxymethyldihydropteridine diphosphokinase [Coriobacteriales bacterium]